MSKKQATLEDVAKAAKVSTATVSRCLNNHPSVRAKTRARVDEAIQRLGYTPNFGARALAAKRTNIVGAIIPTMENAIFASGIQAFQEALSQSGYTLLISSSSYRRDLEAEQIGHLISQGADALLLIGEDRDPEIYQRLRARNIPYVIAWNYREDNHHCFVGFNNHRAASMAAQKLLEFGHKNIGIIAGLTPHNDRARDRLEGYRAAYKAAGIDIAASAIVESAYHFSDAGEAFDKIMDANPKISAVICGNDVLAVGAILRAHSRGIAMPEALSIVGFDDIEIANITSPKLSTVHVPHRQMGRFAAQKIIEALNGESTLESIELETHFVMRESLIPLKKRPNSSA